MAEHIAMMTRTKKGYAVREYFREARDERDANQDTDAIINQFPELRLMREMLNTIADARMEAEHAKTLAAHAQQTALLAQKNALQMWQNQQWITIRQYVSMYRIERQLPEGHMRMAYGVWLTKYCRDRGYPVYDVAPVGVRWKQENQYPTWAIHETLPGWLSRREGQAPLHITEDGVYYGAEEAH
jgi:phage anti-repressor protein